MEILWLWFTGYHGIDVGVAQLWVVAELVSLTALPGNSLAFISAAPALQHCPRKRHVSLLEYNRQQTSPYLSSFPYIPSLYPCALMPLELAFPHH